MTSRETEHRALRQTHRETLHPQRCRSAESNELKAVLFEVILFAFQLYILFLRAMSFGAC